MSLESEKSVTEEMLTLLENPVAELDSSLFRRISRSVVESVIPEGLEEIGEHIAGLWRMLAEQIVGERLAAFARGAASCRGVDEPVCRMLSRLREAYKALFEGLVIVDDAGRVYVRLRTERVIGGLRMPRGAVTSVSIGEALLLYAVGDAEIAAIKPLKE